MTNYIEETNKKYQHPAGIDKTTKASIFDPLEQHIKTWAQSNKFSIIDVKLSGSRAKGTAISLTCDMDILISLSSSITETPENIYNSLFDYFVSQSFVCKKQKATIRVAHNKMNIDLIPGRRANPDGEHSLYSNRKDTGTQTNIDKYIRTVKDSQRVPEIVATKIWRQRHNLSFPSTFLELAVINGLAKKRVGDYDDNFMSLLEYFAESIQAVKIVDPTNPDNIVSDDTTASDKRAIASKANEGRKTTSWAKIFW